jgi:hypothetical protein
MKEEPIVSFTFFLKFILVSIIFKPRNSIKSIRLSLDFLVATALV